MTFIPTLTKLAAHRPSIAEACVTTGDHDVFAPSRRIRLAAVDDHPLVAEGIASYLTRSMGDIRWMGAASSWTDLQRLLRTAPFTPDVVLFDLHLHDGSRPEDGIRELTARDISVVVLTSELRPIPIRQAVRAGAVGVVLKSDPEARIIDVIRAAARGEFAVSGDLAYVLVTDEALTPKLPPREIEVLRLLAAGIPRKAIGSRMTPPVAMSTVVTYLNRICERYRLLGREVYTPADALRAAAEDGYLETPERQRDL